MGNLSRGNIRGKGGALEYNWQRRWLPVGIGNEGGGSSSTARERRFLAIWEMQSAGDGIHLESLRQVSCLILLGEPGMGKSYALRREQRALEAASSAMTLLVDLAGCQDEHDLRARLFDNNTYRDWNTGERQLILYIDSVDQALESAADVVTVVCNELAAADTNRLKLRLVCRDHDWSLYLADRLRHSFRNLEGAPVRVLQLAPIGLDDIRQAAVANRKDADAFLRQLEGANALPLATIPITLEMLLKTDELTDSRVELYRNGMRRLCGPVDDSSSITEKVRHDRFEMAARLAAVMVLGNKHSVDMSGSSVLRNAVIAVSDMLVRPDSEDEEKLLRDTVNSGLFHGSEEIVWAHQSFAEYLTAHYLSSSKVSRKDILRLTTAPDGKFAPQLHEMLRWLSELRSEFSTEVIERQPMLMLNADLSHLSEREYVQVVSAMLGIDDPHIYSHKTWELRKFRARHPSAKQVLAPYLDATAHSTQLRRFVMDLLECHGYPDMEDTLVGLALNRYEDGVLRRMAARGIQEVGSIEAKLDLKPYVFGKEDDPDDEIKGYALRALWPSHLTVDEVFKALTPPKKENFWGSYRDFLNENCIVNNLQPTDLPTALKWVTAQPSRHEMPFALEDLPGQIMRKAWDNRHINGVLEAFAKAAVTRALARFDGVFGRRSNSYPPDEELDEFEKAFVQETQYRRELISMCLSYLVASDEIAVGLVYTWPPLVVPEDLDWLLGLLETETDEARRRQLAELVASLFSSDIEKVYYAGEKHPEVKERTKHFVVTMFDDPTVVSRRKHFRKIKEIEETRKKQLTEARPLERIHDALNQVEAGEALQWLNVIYGLSISSTVGSSRQIEPDITEFPNWSSCEDITRIRIVQAAEIYVLDFRYRPSDEYDKNWYFSNQISHAEISGYRAMFLLLKAGAEALAELPFDIWNRWAKIIVWFPYVHITLNDGRTEHHHQTRDLQQELLCRLYQFAPRAFLENLRQLLVAYDSRDSYIGQDLAKVESLWDPALETTLMDLLRDSVLSAKGQRSLLDILLKHDSDGAARFAVEIIGKGYSSEVEKERLVEFCAGLMLSQLEFNWQAVWKVMQSDESVGRAIVEVAAKDDRDALKFSEHLSALELADLFIWVEERFPTRDDPQIDGFHVVSTREQVGQWRNSLIARIRAKSSHDARNEIRRICNRFPQLEWIQIVRVELEEAAQGLEWVPATPDDILQLFEPEETRWETCRRETLQFFKTNRKWAFSLLERFLEI